MTAFAPVSYTHLDVYKRQLINREEDNGDEGLRRSKESYSPVMLLQKYVTREVG